MSFKPMCRACRIVFDSYKDFIQHCEEKHWRENEVERGGS